MLLLNLPIADYWADGIIDCKDYAVRNTAIVSHLGHKPYWIISNKHLVVVFFDSETIYVFDVNRVYKKQLNKESEMFIEPGILDAAHSKGVKFLGDLNDDGRVDQKDLTLATKTGAKAVVASEPEVTKK